MVMLVWFPLVSLFLLASAGPTFRPECNPTIITDPISGIPDLEKGNLTRTDSKDGITLGCVPGNKKKAALVGYIKKDHLGQWSMVLRTDVTGTSYTDTFACNKDQPFYYYYCFNAPLDRNNDFALQNHLRKTLMKLVTGNEK